MVHERHADAVGVLLHDLLRLLLRTDEQHGPPTSTEVANELVGLLEAGERLLEVDDVDPGSLPEQVALHLRIPPSGLVAEVHAGLEELPPGDDRHVSLLWLSLRPDRPAGGPGLSTLGPRRRGHRTCVLGADAPARAVYQRRCATGGGGNGRRPAIARRSLRRVGHLVRDRQVAIRPRSHDRDVQQVHQDDEGPRTRIGVDPQE